MDFIEFFIGINESLKAFNIDLLIVALVIASGYFQYRYTSIIKINAALKTLIVSSVWVSIYIALTCDFSSWDCVKPCLKTALISYTMATSFYELIVKSFMEKFFPNKESKSE